MQKGNTQLFIIFIFFIILIGVGVYLYQSYKTPISPKSPSVSNSLPAGRQVSNTSNPTNFKDYSNRSLGFSLNYYKDLIIREDSEEEFNQRAAGSASKSVNGDFRKNFKGYVGYEPGQPLGVIVVLEEDQSFDKNPLSLWVFNNPDDLTLDGWFDKYWYYPFLWGVFDYESKGHVVMDQEAAISGKIAKYKVVSYQPNAPKYLYLSNNGKIYLFRIIGESGDKILDSFKFLE